MTLGLPTKEQAGVLSPTAPLCAPQDHTEAVLLGYARSLGAEVEFGREVLRVIEEGRAALGIPDALVGVRALGGARRKDDQM